LLYGTAQKIFYAAKERAGLKRGRGIHTLKRPEGIRQDDVQIGHLPTALRQRVDEPHIRPGGAQAVLAAVRRKADRDTGSRPAFV
jgi:hypothetical protein